MKKLAHWMRRAADRIDREGAPKVTHCSFTFERGRGIVFHEDGRGCRIAYLGDDEYRRAHHPEPSTPRVVGVRMAGNSVHDDVDESCTEENPCFYAPIAYGGHIVCEVGDQTRCLHRPAAN